MVPADDAGQAGLFSAALAATCAGISLDRLLGHLVNLGIPEALRAEDLLRVTDKGTNGTVVGNL